MANVKILRLSTGEDIVTEVIAKSPEITKVKTPFTVVPMQEAPGKPVTLGFHSYIPYGKCDEVTFKQDNVVTSVEPTDELKKTYQKNTGGIVEVEKQLIT